MTPNRNVRPLETLLKGTQCSEKNSPSIAGKCSMDIEDIPNPNASDIA